MYTRSCPAPVRLIQVDDITHLSQESESSLDGPLHLLRTGLHNEDAIQVDKNLNTLLPEISNDCCQNLGKDPWRCGQTKQQSLELIGVSLLVKPQELLVTVHESMCP